MTTQRAIWGVYQPSIEEWILKIQKQSVIQRLWNRDASLWTKDAAAQKEIKMRLGWLEAPEGMQTHLAELLSFAEEIKKEGYQHILLLGMGGSSLAPEVFQHTFGNAEGYPELLVLDSTDPLRIIDIEKKVNLRKTLIVVSSKSGGTIELISLFKYFYAKVEALKAESTGHQFIAITDPGTALEALAKERHFRKVFFAPIDVGGRFSALTYFGLVPAALIGMDVKRILESAESMKKAAGPEIETKLNAAVELGVAMAVLAEEGRDKLTFLTAQGLESFADWAEQLVAESSGKEGLGIIPIVHESLETPKAYGSDRFFVALLSNQESQNASIEQHLEKLKKDGHPILVFQLQDATDLGGEFFRWEMATAIACALLKINAFDQPDVQSSKDRTKTLLDQLESGKAIEIKKTETDLDSFWEDPADGDYVALLAFLPDQKDVREKLSALQTAIRSQTKLATTLGFGPRYLHSTGQLHKGGPNSGIFFLITAPTQEDLAIPDQTYSFGQLECAQAMGDFESLEAKGRWLFHYRLNEFSQKELDLLCAAVIKAVSKKVSVG